MTGFGKAQATVNSSVTTVEVRSVNGRYLELNIKLPKDWVEFESGIRDIIRSQVSRGNVSVYVRKEDAESKTAVAVNLSAAAAYVDALHMLQNELGLSGTIGIENLVGYEPAFRGGADNSAEIWQSLEPVVIQAISALNEMREREGAELVRDMTERLQVIGDTLGTVEALSSQRIPAERERLRERVRQLVGEEFVDEQRLQLEIVLLSEKLDVNEECVRLRAHLKHYQKDLNAGGSVGRKLNFLLQEMNREVNTIGSKANDAQIAVLVVSMKEELERIREQVQNIE